MASFLPVRANLEWLKKLAKERLAILRASHPTVQLADAQFAVAREYGFPSWQKLQAHVELIREKLSAAFPTSAAPAAVPPDDLELAQLLALVQAGDLPAVTQLLGRRPELASAATADGQTALHLAAQCNDPRCGVFLLAAGADPEGKFGRSGHTALSWAVTCNANEFAQTLIRLGANVDLFCAAGSGALDAVRGCFSESGELRPGAAKTGSSRYAEDGSLLPCPPVTVREQISDALYIACRNGQADVVRLLLTKQPDLSFRAYLGGTPLHWAHFGGSREIVALLEQAGADPTDCHNALRCTPRAFGICVPANWGFGFLVRKQLSADPALARLHDGTTTPLHEAAHSGSTEVMEMLLAAGADPTAHNDAGQTPLDIALARGHQAAAAILFNR